MAVGKARTGKETDCASDGVIWSKRLLEPISQLTLHHFVGSWCACWIERLWRVLLTDRNLKTVNTTLKKGKGLFVMMMATNTGILRNLTNVFEIFNIVDSLYLFISRLITFFTLIRNSWKKCWFLLKWRKDFIKGSFNNFVTLNFPF